MLDIPLVLADMCCYHHYYYGYHHYYCYCYRRFLSIPLRPEGTEGWTEDQLQALVTRDSIVGVALAKTPAQLKKEGGTFFPKKEGYKGRFIYQ